jgi:serine phosphatase RsbU (regulator of sigma subunit)
VALPNSGSPTDPPSSGVPRTRQWLLKPVTLVFLVLGLGLTAVLTTSSEVSYHHAEERLTKLDVELEGSDLSAAPNSIARSLGRTVTAVAASGRTSLFGQLLGSSMGEKGVFVNAELFQVTGTSLRLLTSLGGPPLVATGPDAPVRVAASALSVQGISVSHPTKGKAQRLGYATASRGPGGHFVVYAEQILPASRHIPVPRKSPSNELYYVIYLGTKETRSNLLITDAPRLPLRGTKASTTVPFASAKLTLVASPITTLSGTFAEDVPWGILAAGVVLTLAGSLLVEWLMRRRITAEELAKENQRLYEAQRSVSETLQRSLLPERLPQHSGVRLAARYLPGTEGIEVGGDWYDVVEVDERQLFFTVGDVAGRGLEAAVLMTSLRNAIGAYATDGDEPAAVLHKLHRLVDVAKDGRFATVVCGVLDTATGDGILVNAGHLPPILAAETGCAALETRPGPPIGLGEAYLPTLFSLRPGDVLVCYTDGLVERRGEAVTDGVQRLCGAIRRSLPPEQLLDAVLAELVPSGQADDIALLALQRNP